MKFLSLPTLLIAAAVAVPALLLLYFLKLRRREQVISSTLLWRKAVQDLQVNAPFQRLRKSLLLLLQLLVLAGLIFGLGQPVAHFMRTPARTMVILLDQSASMKTREQTGPRLDEVKREAAAFVQNMHSDDRAMLVAFSDRARVVCPFTSDPRELLRQINAIDATDGRSTLAEALQLAVAYSNRIVDVPNTNTPLTAAPSADIELFSDGRIADAADQVVQRGKLHFYRVGAARDNVGLVAMDVRRNYERPGHISIFARVENFGPAPVKTDVTLRLDGRIVSVREIQLGPFVDTTTSPAGSRETVQPAAQALAFDLTHESAGLVEVRIERKDDLAADNVAFAPLAPPQPVSLLGVSDRPWVRTYITRAVTPLPAVSISWMDPNAYEHASDKTLLDGGRSKYDLVMLDRVDTARLPPGNYLFFGGIPKIAGVTASEPREDEYLVTWNETHPLLRYVVFDHVNVARWRTLHLPPSALVLAEGQFGPLLAQLNDANRQFLVLAFDLLESDFPLKVPFAIFMQNAVRTLAADRGEIARMSRPGDTLTSPVPANATRAVITRPDGTTDTLELANRLTASYGRTQDLGVYRMAFDDPPRTAWTWAVNLLDPIESRIAPNDRLAVGADVVTGRSGAERVNQPLWPYAVLAALAVLMLEWWIYNRRVMI